ncbi:uncharacterized protein LOC142975481 [Anticarsia gemmatalis]|uniref:uncharacterized protein LOC142975481 n=1 Tax=Anticarsia gemmatalis TaxID=129554 RepID=UPI003F7661C2
MSIKSQISLIDLSQQLPFELDDRLKKELCFGESLIISCGHYEGDIDDGSSDSTWTCRETSSSESSREVQNVGPTEIKDFVEEETKHEEEDEEDNDFHFFFYPDCKKPIPKQHSRTSVVMVGGLPQVNPSAKEHAICTCPKDKKGKCKCFVKIPCSCGAKVKDECTCRLLEDICICTPQKPAVSCKCNAVDVCICDSNTLVKTECVCEDVRKPCICPPFKFPCPVCKCKHKPKLNLEAIDESVSSFHYEGEEDIKFKKESDHEPCTCQEPEPKPRCFCQKGKDCICNVVCVCGIRRTCLCEPTDSADIPCKGDENKSICSCEEPPKICTCDVKKNSQCNCFPQKTCTCGDPENCKCFSVCDCKDPCICDTAPPPQPKACICVDTWKPGLTDLVCTCPKVKDNKLKKVRAGKEGYRWCREVDPMHTYFDYGYGRHDKIEQKKSETEKFVIQGLHDQKPTEEECAVHGVKAPKYEKKVRKPSLDCCSAVGGISISVETLGEDKDKFLVQVVSYSSKEGAKTGSKLVSILDCNLHTMEENRTEHITKKNLTKEKRSYLAICENGYYNKVTRICGESDVVKRIYHTFEKAHDFLLEGASIVLMRYFAISRYRGNVKTDTVMMDGVICQSIYVCLGVGQAIVNGCPLFVVKVERHIIEPSGFIHQSLTALTLRGHIVSHEWADNTYIMHLNPLLEVNPEKDEIEPHAPLRSRWRQDLQLLSDYLDFKTVRTSEGGRYITESGALTGAVRDYLQAILLLRPHDTLHFTRHYFGAVLSALDLPHDEYFDPSAKHVRYYFFEE